MVRNAHKINWATIKDCPYMIQGFVGVIPVTPIKIRATIKDCPYMPQGFVGVIPCGYPKISTDCKFAINNFN